MLTITWAAALLLPTAIQAVTFDCNHVEIDRQKFNLSPLSGPKAVHWQVASPPSITNTTFTLDICKPLKKDSNIANEEQCPSGTRVCAIERDYAMAVKDDGKNDGTVHKVIPIAGEFATSHGRSLDPKVTRLKDGSSNEDAEREGLRVELNGGRYPDSRSGRTQRAIIEFLCDRNLDGTEGFTEAETDSSNITPREYKAMAKRQDGDNDDIELPDLDKDKSLQFVSYKAEGKEGEIDVLRLTWKTKYACEGEASKTPNSPAKGNWGFFTWFIIILFLLAASYIIFGSWLNYNRYGARGWDLVPHGDAIRDMPYLVKDWSANVMDRVRGGSGGSRGGYSAV
ncbi:Hypothetical protein R9X50_00644400 [Acrodontium crateriforme]|uniref:Autophagy-related protein 27 n=1 Tax=Acrodontium crateriforme TaxID=150365 RepID=A0AAQ3MB01_9PEZI|nr:Hypothetical protein R9X50_00644400 [Acrodontium crateriforme]